MRAFLPVLTAFFLVCTLVAVTSTPAFGAGLGYFGSAPSEPARSAAKVGITSTPTGNGYWLVAADGDVFAFGDARFHGSMATRPLTSPIVGMTTTPTGKGYWLVAADGGVFAFGDAPFLGSTGATRLKSPIVGMTTTPTGKGYWLVAADGGVFAFGDAPFLGSTGATRLKSPIVGIARTGSGNGYLLAAADGGIFAFGQAEYFGSAAGRTAAPVTDIATNPNGSGYWLITAVGGVFSFGGAPLFGNGGAGSAPSWVIGIAPANNAHGYWLATSTGDVLALGPERRPITDSLRAQPPPTTPPLAVDMFNRINAERAARGLDPVVWDERLASRATAWSQKMPTNGFQHQPLSNVLSASGSAGPYSGASENIYWGSGSAASAAAAHETLMNSPPHRKTITQPAATVVGIGVVCTPDGRLFVTQDFGTWRGWPAPLPAKPSADPLPRPVLSAASPSC